MNLRDARTVMLLKYVAAHPQGLREDSAIIFMAKVCESSRGGLYVVKDAEVRQLVAGRFRIMHLTPEGRTFLKEHDHSASPGTGEASAIDKDWDGGPVKPAEPTGSTVAAGRAAAAPPSTSESMTDR